MKKGKVFVNKIEKNLKNNQDYCEVVENDDRKVLLNINENIEDKIDRLFNTNGYIFNVDVKIITDNKIYNTKIASRVGNNLITLDNNIIEISDIKDIVF